ncbi:sensor histidine kinase [uncultured Amnibacterium sp.]|uniref:sensor histidine kinase n=1 Tax=uncultured Amnibacterium sp. TaxID=1631851 RepID=UPI0035CB5012
MSDTRMSNVGMSDAGMRGRRGWDTAFDIAVAVVFAGIAFLEAASHADDGYRGTGPALIGGLLSAAAPLPLAARRIRPLTSAAAVAALATLPHLVQSYDVVSVGALLPLAIGAEGAARYGRRPVNRWALLFPVPGLVLLSITIPGFAGQVAVYAAIIAIGWTTGVLIRALIERREALARQIEARHALQALLVEQALADERSRIARDLHDVIAHCVSVMVLQSGAARLRMAVDPAGSAAAIAQVESTGHDALVELRRVLGLLRGDPADDPSSSLAHLTRLTEQLHAAGLTVSVSVQGDPSALPPALDRTVYRVVQESLTNALKHGSDSRADLLLQVHDDRVELEVQNAASAPPRAELPGGNGQVGMRERVAAFGGQLTTETRSGRYRLHALLPMDEARR